MDREEEKKMDDHDPSPFIKASDDSNASGIHTYVPAKYGVEPTRIPQPHSTSDCGSTAGRGKGNPRRHTGAVASTILRVVLLDVPLILSLTLYLGMVSLERIGRDYLLPQVLLQKFTSEEETTGLTYYHRICDASDASTASDPSDLVGESDPTDDSPSSIHKAKQIMLEHGVTVLPNLLSPTTATALRDFILAENAVSSNLLYVIENQQRWSFPLVVDQHASVRTALDEILHQPALVRLLEALAGPNPAVIEFTAITQAYGAQSQFWHQDVGNAAKYGRNFVPSYGLFIPLQNVTANMGATGICPGTHICANDGEHFCNETGFQLSGRANSWAVGTGALLNQQTTHRGEAHLDPDAQQRVVFMITFAPRPQTKPATVETRLLGLGGSYSLHWSHWGHTLADFQQPLLHMRRPWRELRSLGLYKPRHAQWGWDYATVTSGRIANDDMNSRPHPKELKWLLPIWLRGTSTRWVVFLYQTAQKCREVSARIYLAHAVACVVVSAFLALKEERRGRTRRFVIVVHSMIRIVLIHAALVLVTSWLIRHAMMSDWGQKIDSKRSFALSPAMTLPLTNRPATLPTKQDILVFEGMQSRYLDSYTRILEVTHPGNKAWQQLVSSLARGYNRWSRPVQRQVQQTLRDEVTRQGRRILAQNSDFEWAEVSPPLALWWTHKCLLQQSSQHVNVAVETVDFLLSEIRFGYWRSSVLQQRFISAMLADLRARFLLGVRSESDDGDALGSRVGQRSSLPASLSIISSVGLPCRSGVGWSHLPPIAARDLPVSRKRRNVGNVLARLLDDSENPHTVLPSVGDVVDANVVGPNKDIWYRARVISAHSKSMTWNVVYDDADEGLGLCLKCVRPFTPYTSGETVEVLVSDKDAPTAVYATGTIHSVTSTRLHVRFRDTGQEIVEAATKDIRRRY